jgi:hypothetical protein
MKKNRFLVLGTLAAMLTFGFVFAGCEDKAEETTEPTETEKAATALAEKLGAEFAEASGTTVTLKKNTEIGEAVTVEAGVTLATDEYTLTVGDGKTLTVAGAVNVDEDGEIEVASGGTLDVAAAGTLDVAGVLSLADGADGDLKGTINVTSPGTAKDLKSGGGALWKDENSTGKYVFNAGAKVYVGGEDADDLLIGGSGDPETTTWIQLASGTFSNTQTGYTLAGNATLRTSFGLNGAQTLTIKTGGKLTVEIKSNVSNPGVAYAYLAAYPDGSGIVGEGTAAIEVKAPGSGITGGTIYFIGDGSDGSGTTANFYNSSGAKLTTSAIDSTDGATMVPVGVYNWDADADTTTAGNQPGWKAEATAEEEGD